jgi:hypothetical protein
MIPWRKIAVLGFVGTCLFAGCTVTTSDGSGVGGSGFGTGGTWNGGGTGGTGTVSACNPDAEQPNSCGKCLQTLDANNGMCTEYLACGTVSGCTGIINAMSNCMYGKSQVNGGDLPTTADAECRSATAGMSTTDTYAAAQAAQVFWDQIVGNINCTYQCYAT